MPKLASEQAHPLSALAGRRFSALDNPTTGLAKRANRDRIPMTFVAIENDQPVGSASLVIHDMTTRVDLSPWLAGVFVLPAYRNRGIASSPLTPDPRFLILGSSFCLSQVGFGEFRRVSMAIAQRV